MNQEQFDRWKQVGLGLAQSYKDLTPARKAKLLAEVDDCIEWVVCNGLETVDDWDSSVKIDGIQYSCAGTRVDDFLWDNRFEFERHFKNGDVELVRGKFGDMLISCVRAGFDMAVSPSAGVVGFTVGDLRDIFDGTIPDWKADQFGDNRASLLGAGRSEGVWL